MLESCTLVEADCPCYQARREGVGPAPEITFDKLDGRQALAQAEQLRALHAEVYADLAPEAGDDGSRIAGRFGVQCRQPGFALVQARSGGYLIGYAAGMPLRPSTSWWRNLTTPLPDQVTDEHAGRTFAVVELLVRASWRRQGIGRSLHDLLLAGRDEERATVVVPSGAAAAQSAFRSWGWRRIARTRDPGSASATSDVLITTLGHSRDA